MPSTNVPRTSNDLPPSEKCLSVYPFKLENTNKRQVYVCTRYNSDRVVTLDPSDLATVAFEALNSMWKEGRSFEGSESKSLKDGDYTDDTEWRSAILSEHEYKRWMRGREAAAAIEEQRAVEASERM